MDIQMHTQPDKLERYSFLWSEARLLIAALALFLGGVPPILKFNPIPGLYGTISSLLVVAWIISGLAAAYLFYRWNAGGRKVLGGMETKDATAFFIMIVSGFNLGLTGILGQNIGMSISSDRTIFVLVGILYLLAAWHLWKRWKSCGEKLFSV